MAVDSKQKRYSLLGLFTPDAAVDHSDRYTALHLYGGIGGAAPGSFSVSVTDGLKLGDLARGQAVYYVTVADGLKLGELVGSIEKYIYDVDITDGLKLGELAGGSGEYYRDATDGLKLGDAVSEVAKYIYDVSVTDGLRLGDVVDEVAKYIYRVSATDGLKLGERARGIIYQQLVEALDGLKLGEYGDATISYPLGIQKRETRLRFIFRTPISSKGLKFH